MNKKKLIILISILVIIVVIAGLYGTYATNSTVDVTSEATYSVTLNNSTEGITVPSNSSRTVIYQITNTNKGKVKYGVAYSGTNITVKIYNNSKDKETGIIDYGENKFIKLYITNTGATASTATLSAVLGYENGGDLIIPSGKTLVTETYKPQHYPIPISTYITGLYTDGQKETVATISDIKYHYVRSEGLMNDRLGGTNDDLDEGNIRYYGSDPNNYIYFNCSDYNNQSSSTCDLWRIIGVFDGKTKIAQAYNLLYEPFDYNGSNDFSNATINYDTLNGSFKNGLKPGTEEKIAEVTWDLGGFSEEFYNFFPENAYEFERTDDLYGSWFGKIALIYPSDYLYATDLSQCSEVIRNYNKFECYGNDWLFNDKYTPLLLLTPVTYNSYSVIDIDYEGFLSELTYAGDSGGVRPTLFLNADEQIYDGDGSESNPYKLLP